MMIFPDTVGVEVPILIGKFFPGKTLCVDD